MTQPHQGWGDAASTTGGTGLPARSPALATTQAARQVPLGWSRTGSPNPAQPCRAHGGRVLGGQSPELHRHAPLQTDLLFRNTEVSKEARKLHGAEGQ